jgi:hypothetical protein
MSLARGLPPIDAAQLPSDIRTAAGGRGRIRNAYEAGLGFERLLVQQLTQSLADSARDALAGDSPYASLPPDALADGVMDGGGLGLARQLTAVTSPAGDPLAVTGGRNPSSAGDPLAVTGGRNPSSAGDPLAVTGGRNPSSPAP